MTVLPATGHASPTSRAWDEKSCLEGCARNSLSSQEQFYRHFYPKMMALVHRYTLDRDEACSILNNGFLKAFRNVSKFRGEGSLEGWLRKIIVHAVADYFRYKHPPVEVSKEVLPEANMPGTELPSAHDYNKLLEVLGKLPAATRTVVNLFLVDGCTHKEISKLMGISENTSKWHVSEGRKQLQQLLNPLKR